MSRSLEIDSYEKKPPPILAKIPHFFELFSKMNDIIDEKYSKSSAQFFQFRRAIQRKMQLLHLIKSRYLDSADLVKKGLNTAKRKLELYTTADPNVLQEASEFSERWLLARRSLVLDLESFLMFSRVVLDHVPWMLQPCLKEYVAHEEPEIVDFQHFCEWFRDNPDKVKDEEFRSFLLHFYSWFLANLGNPHNDLVIHSKRTYTLDSISPNGQVIRFKYDRVGLEDSIEERFELPSPVVSFQKIYDFLIDLEDYFLKIL
ncbi:MAG: hypothetical protein ACFFDC_21310 [Promethearchaeota archaeon]